MVHSTSWRHDAESRALILTHVAVIAVTSSPRGLVEQRVERAPLARGGATTPPARMRTEAVLSHAMEHLASLLRVDPAIRSALPPEWTPALAPYVPEPFRELGGYPVIAEPRAAHLAARTLAALWSASVRSSRIATYPSEP